jgi:hypothetical protein
MQVILQSLDYINLSTKKKQKISDHPQNTSFCRLHKANNVAFKSQRIEKLRMHVWGYDLGEGIIGRKIQHLVPLLFGGSFPNFHEKCQEFRQKPVTENGRS